MKNKATSRIAMVVFMLGLTACSGDMQNPPAENQALSSQSTEMKIASNKRMVSDFYEMLFTQRNVTEAARKYLGQDYFQHSPSIADGRAGFISDMSSFVSEHPLLRVHVYLQHHPTVADGTDAFVAAFKGANPKTGIEKMKFPRTIAEGDFVMIQAFSSNGIGTGGQGFIDIFRFNEEGKIVEHWDAVQKYPSSTKSKRTVWDNVD